MSNYMHDVFVFKSYILKKYSPDSVHYELLDTNFPMYTFVV